MRRVVVTGLGFITSIGNNRADVLESLKTSRTGVERFPEFEGDHIPVKLAGTVKGFAFPTYDFEDWVYPKEYRISRVQMRPMAPHCVYGFCAMQQAIRDAGLTPDQVSNPRTGAMCASSGSMLMAYHNLHIMETKGLYHAQPTGVVSGIPGTLNINLAACFQLKGATLGFASACASSAHAFGTAVDLIRLDRQDVVFAVGAEDCTRLTMLPFAASRTLSLRVNPAETPCAFDVKRDGFVPTGGAAVVVLESLEHAQRRGAAIQAEVLGWGESSDGYNVVAPEPNGEGLARCMTLALADAAVPPGRVDYINAHATSTVAGDVAELRAIKSVFGGGKIPHVSSTKSLTGHGLSLAGAMEAGFTVLALKERFTPVSAHITELDPECAGVPVVVRPVDAAPEIALSNSSGFGGTNVTLVLKRWNE
jgi:3-oxoacyl-[acyl-carrier-protein] synthase-1